MERKRFRNRRKKRQQDAKTFNQIVANLHKYDEEYKKSAADNIETWYGMTSQMQKDFASSISGAILNGENLFESFFKKVGAMWVNMIADMASKQIFQPVLDKVWSGTYGASGVQGLFNYQLWGNQYNYSSNPNFVGPVQPGGATIGGMAGGAAIGYGMGGLAGAAGGVGGYVIGSQIGSVGGPVGMLVGAAIGSIMGDMLKEDPEPIRAEINTMWSIIGDKVELISSSWRDISDTEGTKIVESYRLALKNQVEFANRMAAAFGGSVNTSLTFGSVGVLTADQIGSAAAFDDMIRNFSNYSKAYGKKFTDEFTTILEGVEFTRKYAGIGKGFSVPTGLDFSKDKDPYEVIREGIINSMEQNKLYYSTIPTLGIGASQDAFNIILKDIEKLDLKTIIGQQIGVGFSESTNTLYDDLQEILFPFQEGMINSISQAFLNAKDTNGFTSFEENLRQIMSQNITQTISNMLGSVMTPMMTEAFLPGFTSAEEYMQDVLLEKPTDISKVETDFLSGINMLSPIITEFGKPGGVFEQLLAMTSKLNDSLGINNDAITQNTEAILGPVNSYLEKLMGMDTGPTSTAFFASQQEKYWTSAFADPEKFSEYANFMTGGALDFIKQTSADWSTWISSEKAKVENVPG